MSEETATWLNTRTLQGFTAKRGEAWHYDGQLQQKLGNEPNHYEGAIPVEDVRRRLLDWEPVRAEQVDVTYVVGSGAKSRTVTMNAPQHVAMLRPAKAFGASDPGEVFEFFKGSSYAKHGFDEWCVQNLSLLLDGGLQVGSAGLLKGGAVFWLQAEMEETQEVAGIPFRPFITAATSCNGWIATTYFTGAKVVVCDNTLSGAIRDPRAAIVKVRHSSKSLTRLGEMRDALGIVQEVGADFTAQVNALLDHEMNDRQWARFLDETAGLVDEKGKKRELLPMHRANADTKARTLNWVASSDDRVKPWVGNAFGAVQLLNTFQHHITGVANDDRAGRNQMRAVQREWDALDHSTLLTVERITRKTVKV